MKCCTFAWHVAIVLGLLLAGCSASPTVRPPTATAPVQPSRAPAATLTATSLPPTSIPEPPLAMFRGGLTHLGVAEPTGAAVEWIVNTASPQACQPVLTPEGLLFGGLNGIVHLANLKTGKDLWTFQADSEVSYSLVYAEGVIYLGTGKGSLYALDGATGKQKWLAHTGAQIISTPAVTRDTLFVGSGDGNVYAFDVSTGKERWKFTTQGPVIASPALAGGLLLLGSSDSVFYALDAASGERVWSFKAQSGIWSSAAVEGERIYFGSEGGTIYALDLATGEEQWRFQANGGVTSSPAVAGGLVYAASVGGEVYALDAGSGQPQWKFAIKEPIISSPAVAGGSLYFGGLDGRLYALDAKSGIELWRFQAEGEVWSSPLVAGDFIYFGSFDSRLYALNRQAPQVALAPTPTAPPLEPTPTMLPEPNQQPKRGATGLPWWNDRIFYEVFVRSFQDSNGDGTGDLQGLISRLDYLNDGNPNTHTDLGVTGIWLMPVSESPSYHGYDTVDYKTVEQDYGTNEDLKQLIAEAHKRGMVVIVDLVMNHVSNQHPWFLDAQKPGSEHESWFIWENENPGFLSPWNSPVWHRLGLRYYYGLFWEGMPDLNYENGAVTNAMFDVIRFWLDEMRVDGFRLDAVRHLVEEGPVQENTPETHAWLQDFHRFVRSLSPQAFTVGEAWTSPDQVVKYVGNEVDVAFEFALAKSILESVLRGDNYSLASTEKQVLALYPQGQYATFLSNHDQDRVMAQLMGDPEAAKLAATLLLTHPGVPFIYYGEEIGMRAARPDELVRAPMQWDGSAGAGFTSGTPWLAPGSNTAQFNVAAETGDPASLLNHYRTLIALRQAHPALRGGDTWLVDSTTRKVFSYLRRTQNESILVVVNLSKDTVSDYQLSLASANLRGKPRAQLLLGEGEAAAPALNAAGGFDAYQPLLALPPRSSLVILLR